MSLPSSNNTHTQPSIRNFFRPKQPAYAAPPASSKRSTEPATLSPTPPTANATTTATATVTAAAPTTQPTATVTALPLSRPANLHPQATISRIRPEHIPALRRITSLLLPVNYPDSFYARLSDPLSSGAFSRVILWRDDGNNSNNSSRKGSHPHSHSHHGASSEKVIGGLVCRPEPSPFHAGSVDGPRSTSRHGGSGGSGPAQPNALYIQSLVLLSPYRGLGLAAALLDEVVVDAARSEFACETVWAHVWTRNDEGLRWYTARGFARVDEVKNYYHKLHPDSAWIVRREIGPGAALGVNGYDGLGAGAAGATVEVAHPGYSVTAAVANLLPVDTPGIASPRGPPSLELLSKTHSAPATPAAPPTSGPPRSPAPPTHSGRSTPGQSFQNMRPETEWNDLPPDMHSGGSKAASSSNLSVPGSNASSRSSSTARKKRDRAYPAAAFGN